MRDAGVGVFVLAGCAPKAEEPKVMLGACRKADVVPACRGAAPARLTERDLEAGLLTDVRASAGALPSLT